MLSRLWYVVLAAKDNARGRGRASSFERFSDIQAGNRARDNFNQTKLWLGAQSDVMRVGSSEQIVCIAGRSAPDLGVPVFAGAGAWVRELGGEGFCEPWHCRCFTDIERKHYTTE